MIRNNRSKTKLSLNKQTIAVLNPGDPGALAGVAGGRAPETKGSSCMVGNCPGGVSADGDCVSQSL